MYKLQQLQCTYSIEMLNYVIFYACVSCSHAIKNNISDLFVLPVTSQPRLGRDSGAQGPERHYIHKLLLPQNGLTNQSNI